MWIRVCNTVDTATTECVQLLTATSSVYVYLLQLCTCSIYMEYEQHVVYRVHEYHDADTATTGCAQSTCTYLVA